MAAKCANARELRSAINAIVAARACAVHDTCLTRDFDLTCPHLCFDRDDICQCPETWSGLRQWIPLHEFILRALGQWVEEPKELTLETAKELLGKCAGVMAASKKRIEGEGRTTFELDLVFDKLAEYGIKP